jgi:uncharacterized protein with HEPN domain
MYDAATEVIGFLSGRSRRDIEQDRLLSLSVVRLLEIVGEAASRVTETARIEIRTIPWRKIIGMRNHLVHGYDDIDFDVVWKVVTEDLPPLTGRWKPSYRHRSKSLLAGCRALSHLSGYFSTTIARRAAKLPAIIR